MEQQQLIFTEAEQTILDNLKKEYKWISRDGLGELFVSDEKPIFLPNQKNLLFSGRWRCYLPFDNLFKDITWESKQSYCFRKPKEEMIYITDREYKIIKFYTDLYKDMKYLARDYKTGMLYGYCEKPTHGWSGFGSSWIGNGMHCVREAEETDFPYIKSNDGEPFEISKYFNQGEEDDD